MNQLDDLEPKEAKEKSAIWAYTAEELSFPILFCSICWLGCLYYEGDDKFRVPILAIIAGIAVFILTENLYVGLLSRPNKKQLTPITILIISLFAVLFFPKAILFINAAMTSDLMSQLPFKFKSWYYWDLIKFTSINFMMVAWMPIAIIRHLSHVFKIIEDENFEYDKEEMFQFSSVASLLVFCIHFIINDFPL